MLSLFYFFLAILASPFKATSRLEAENAAVPVVDSIQLACDAESDDPLRDVGSLQNNFWDCRRSIPTARGVGSRDPGVAAADLVLRRGRPSRVPFLAVDRM